MRLWDLSSTAKGIIHGSCHHQRLPDGSRSIRFSSLPLSLFLSLSRSGMWWGTTSDTNPNQLLQRPTTASMAGPFSTRNINSTETAFRDEQLSYDGSLNDLCKLDSWQNLRRKKLAMRMSCRDALRDVRATGEGAAFYGVQSNDQVTSTCVEVCLISPAAGSVQAPEVSVIHLHPTLLSSRSHSGHGKSTLG